MIVAIAGAHGKIAMALTRRLVDGGDVVTGLIRNPGHATEVSAQGATPVVCDLERSTAADIAAAITDADAVVFAAGAGPGSGSERKLTMDRDGAIKLLEAAATVGAPRFLIISSVGAESPPDDDEVFSVYLQAKAAADEAVRASDRDWTVLRPGPLTDDPGNGRVRLDADPFRSRVSREDVAAVLTALLHEPRSARRTLYLGGGEQPIAEAVQHVLSEPA